MSRPPQDTIVALATPPGNAALAVIRVSGPLCVDLATLTCAPTPPPRRASLRNYRSLGGKTLDQLVALFFRGPASFTGEDMLELSTHGNPLVAQLIIQDLLARGCRMADPGDFSRRAFLNGRMDLTQAEAVMDLIHARSERALQAAQAQLNGSLGTQLLTLTDQLLQILAQIEAYIDFPDEDLPPENRARLCAELADVLRGTKQLLATHAYGNLLREGIKTVILGEPNAGKSSLMNRLVGHNRALVSDTPGTTRDYLEEQIMVGSHALRLIDTAGLNPTPEEIERLGINQTLERLNEADLILLVLSAGRPCPELTPEVLTHLQDRPTLIIINKSDLGRPTPELPTNLAGLPQITLSAKTGQNWNTLPSAIETLANQLQPDTGSASIAINARHADALRRTQEALQRATDLLEQNAPTELLSSEIREAMDAIGDIRGRIDNERMLDHLFATFCIGK